MTRALAALVVLGTLLSPGPAWAATYEVARFLRPGGGGPGADDGYQMRRRRLRLALVRVRRTGPSLFAVVRVSRRARVGGVLLQRGKRIRRLRPRRGVGRLNTRMRYQDGPPPSLRLTATAGPARAKASLRFRIGSR